MNFRDKYIQLISTLFFALAAVLIILPDANGFELTSESLEKSFTQSEGDTIIVSSEGANLSYDITEIRAEAGSTLTIQYINRGDLPHNVVLVRDRSDINPVGVAALQASQTGYIPQDDANQQRILAYTTLAKPGETVYITFTVPPPGKYPYICTYAGHFTMMQGDLISE